MRWLLSRPRVTASSTVRRSGAGVCAPAAEVPSAIIRQDVAQPFRAAIAGLKPCATGVILMSLLVELRDEHVLERRRNRPHAHGLEAGGRQPGGQRLAR